MIINEKDFDIVKIETPKNSKFKDLTGQKFGRLSVVQYAGRQGRKSTWLCRCECGNWSTNIVTWTLTAGVTTSCGCFSKEKLAEGRNYLHNGVIRHGMAKTRVYNIWRGILQRCNNPKASKYDNYGGRGIKVCERWRKFENFYEDMGDPLENQTIERIDSDKDYSPENCKWATYAEQNRNTKNNNKITLNGKTQCLTDWCKEYGIKITTVLGRIERNWIVEEALKTPTKKSSRIY